MLNVESEPMLDYKSEIEEKDITIDEQKNIIGDRKLIIDMAAKSKFNFDSSFDLTKDVQKQKVTNKTFSRTYKATKELYIYIRSFLLGPGMNVLLISPAKVQSNYCSIFVLRDLSSIPCLMRCCSVVGAGWGSCRFQQQLFVWVIFRVPYKKYSSS